MVAGDLELPPLSLTLPWTMGTHSLVINVTYPDYLLPTRGSSTEDSMDDDEDDDPEWAAWYAEFAADSDEANSDWELHEPDVIHKVGPIQDVSFDDCDFESRYADGHWDSLATTLLGDRKNFLGSKCGPTRRRNRREVHLHEFFDIFWTESDLSLICTETNKYAMQESIE